MNAPLLVVPPISFSLVLPQLLQKYLTLDDIQHLMCTSLYPFVSPPPISSSSYPRQFNAQSYLTLAPLITCKHLVKTIQNNNIWRAECSRRYNITNKTNLSKSWFDTFHEYCMFLSLPSLPSLLPLLSLLSLLFGSSFP